jgi:hypothetical protein
MSTNAIRIHCNNCDYEYLEHFQPIKLRCQFGDGVVTYHCTTSWCNQCKKIRYVESLPTVDELKHKYDEFVASFMTPPATGIRNIFTRLIGFILPFGSVNERNKRFKELSNRIAWRKARSATPHCLTCGTADITPVDFERVNDELSVSVNFRHSCGGKLVIDMNDDPDIRIHFSNSVIWMDIAGNKLKDGEDE